jgi:hypothetical protein
MKKPKKFEKLKKSEKNKSVASEHTHIITYNLQPTTLKRKKRKKRKATKIRNVSNNC